MINKEDSSKKFNIANDFALWRQTEEETLLSRGRFSKKVDRSAAITFLTYQTVASKKTHDFFASRR